MIPDNYKNYDDDADLRYTKEWLLEDERKEDVKNQNQKYIGRSYSKTIPRPKIEWIDEDEEEY